MFHVDTVLYSHTIRYKALGPNKLLPPTCFVPGVLQF